MVCPLCISIIVSDVFNHTLKNSQKSKNKLGDKKVTREREEVLKFEPPSLKLRRPGSTKVLKLGRVARGKF
jgi:hypothetical protein